LTCNAEENDYINVFQDDPLITRKEGEYINIFKYFPVREKTFRGVNLKDDLKSLKPEYIYTYTYLFDKKKRIKEMTITDIYNNYIFKNIYSYPKRNYFVKTCYLIKNGKAKIYKNKAEFYLDSFNRVIHKIWYNGEEIECEYKYYYGERNRLEKIEEIGYRFDGSPMEPDIIIYEYDERNRIKSVGGLNFSYLDNNVVKISSPEYFEFPDGEIIKNENVINITRKYNDKNLLINEIEYITNEEEISTNSFGNGKPFYIETILEYDNKDRLIKKYVIYYDDVSKRGIDYMQDMFPVLQNRAEIYEYDD